ncbi:MAG TPA: hypothetical protein PLZ44_01810, partial [Methanothrix sp.]|nr:hypothetical protein [Methanothrix sp.]
MRDENLHEDLHGHLLEHLSDLDKLIRMMNASAKGLAWSGGTRIKLNIKIEGLGVYPHPRRDEAIHHCPFR